MRMRPPMSNLSLYAGHPLISTTALSLDVIAFSLVHDTQSIHLHIHCLLTFPRRYLSPSTSVALHLYLIPPTLLSQNLAPPLNPDTPASRQPRASLSFHQTLPPSFQSPLPIFIRLNRPHRPRPLISRLLSQLPYIPHSPSSLTRLCLAAS